MIGRALQESAAATRRFVDLLLPPRCLGCGATVLDPASLCASCWTGLTFITAPHCACCGLPFSFADEIGQGSMCAACFSAPPRFDRARSALVYDDASRPLILAFKRADRTDAAPMFGRWLARAGEDLLDKADVIAPVPLHRWRLFHRRYNQAALLAQVAGKATGVRCVPDLLVRSRATPSQGTLGKLGRRRNVAGAFAIHPRHRGLIEGKRVVLVDDVYTTGATLEECAKVLRRAEPAAIEALTLARVVLTDG
jgi:ComF family protein